MSDEIQTTREPPARDLVERLIERRDDMSVEAAEVIIGLRGALSRFRQWMRDAKELPNVQP